MVVKLFNLIRFRASMHLILETGEHKSFAQQQNAFRLKIQGFIKHSTAIRRHQYFNSSPNVGIINKWKQQDK